MRFAIGAIRDGLLNFKIVKQIPNVPVGRKWDICQIESFCREAVAFAKDQGATVGIDSWGVDHAFLGSAGQIIEGPIQYRDETHQRKFEQYADLRPFLFEKTGIAHQPFNTVYQLLARAEEDPSLQDRGDWYLLPDLLNFLLTKTRQHELTQASTTQLMALDGTWCSEIFEEIKWPIPREQPQPSGRIIGNCEGTQIVSVASHDTGSAVIGVGSLSHETAYLNVGTWALLGTLVDHPVTSREAESHGYTNERHFDGRVRFLKNIPGFYMIHRVFAELNLDQTIEEWLSEPNLNYLDVIDPLSSELFNPHSMIDTLNQMVENSPSSPADWAQLVLESSTQCVAREIPALAKIVGRELTNIRLVGGGSQCRTYREKLAFHTGLSVELGYSEATLVGNLALQFVATGALSREHIAGFIDSSFSEVGSRSGGQLFASI